MRLFTSSWTAPASVMSALALAACSSNTNSAASETPAPKAGCCSPTVLANGLRIAERYRVASITRRRFNHAELWRAIAPYTSSSALVTREIGRSVQGREIRSVSFGTGPITVLLWSQMHGDEATATMALADIFRFLAEAKGDSLRERLSRALTIVAVPMLNPDGAELFQRENAIGVDINRDGRRLATPEARALKALRDSLHPQFGFNLHDQGARTRVGDHGLPAAIALLAPAYDEARSYNEVRSRARLVAATIATTLNGEITGRIARYDDTFNPRAFGDLMQQWGTSTVLIESGALPGDPEKQHLRALNVAALLAALDAIATGSYHAAPESVYESLAYNVTGTNDVLVLGGQLVLPGRKALLADIAINYDESLARTGGRIRDVGDLQAAVGIDTLDATGLFIHPSAGSLTTRDGQSWLRLGAPAVFELRKGASPSSELVRRISVNGTR
ncbi:MAG: M14 family zinc carboxypeptidase [Gemmatimonadota bacterium]